MAAIADFPQLKESVSHVMAQLYFFLYIWLMLCDFFFQSSMHTRFYNVVTTSMQLNDIGRPKKDIKLHRRSYDVFSLKSACINKSRKENPQKLSQLSSRSHPKHLVGKRTAQKDTIIDITSDSQVNSNFPYRWSPASLTFNNYFYLFLYLYIT